MNEKSGALPDNENNIQSEKKQSAISAEFQWVSGKNYSSANWTVMVISGSVDAAGSGESAGREVYPGSETGIDIQKKALPGGSAFTADKN